MEKLAGKTLTDIENILTVCMVCHTAIERGLLKTTGRAPDQIQWEGPFGMIEQPLEAANEKVSSSGARSAETSDDCIARQGAPLVRETSPGYGDPTHASRESSLIAGTPLSGRFVGATHEPISCVDPCQLSQENGQPPPEISKPRYGAKRYSITPANMEQPRIALVPHVSHATLGQAWDSAPS